MTVIQPRKKLSLSILVGLKFFQFSFFKKISTEKNDRQTMIEKAAAILSAKEDNAAPINCGVNNANIVIATGM